VIDEAGNNLGIMTKLQAIELAESKELDLVCVSPKMTPPICKIVEWSHFKYERQKKEKENKKRAQKIKEIRFNIKIAENDLERKLNKAREFLSKKFLVKLAIVKKRYTTKEQTDDFQKRILTKLDNYCSIIQVQDKGKNVYILIRAKV